MPRFFASISLFAVVLFAVSAVAQHDRAIDLFENQDELPSGTVSVESTDGSPIVVSSDGDDSSGGNSSGRYDGGLTLTYERNGSSIMVPAKIQGRSVYFLFDTGASYTTLTGAFASKAGIMPGEGYPSTMVQTANGPAVAQFGLIRSLVLAGRTHGGVSFTVCDACPSGMYKGKPIVGLLGMNVLGRYRTSFDDARGVIEMVPTIAYSDRARDIEPWIQVAYDRGERKGESGKHLAFIGRVKNNAPRRIEKMTVRFQCAGGKPVDVSKSVPAGRSAKFEAAVMSGDCRKDFDAKIVDSRW